MNGKVLAIAAVVVLLVAGVGVGITVMNNDKDKEKTGGLYDLKATVMDIDMGGMSSTPKVVETVEYMYKSVYGDLADGADKLTLADAKEDKTFWDTYAKYEVNATVDGDGKITYTTLSAAKTKTTVVLDGKADTLIFTGTAYPTILYWALCEKYHVERYSDAAKNNADLVNEFKSIVVGSLKKDSVSTSTPELVEYLPDGYLEHCGALSSYEVEQIGQDVKSFAEKGKRVIFMGSGTISSGKYNEAAYKAVDENGGYTALNDAASIPKTLAGIDLVGKILGYSSYTDEIIKDIQLRLYKVWWSAQQYKDQAHKAYFEGSSGTASKSTGSGAELCKFFGWDVSLFDGKEHDTESLLKDKPDILMFYTNDDRTEDQKMRVSS